MRTRRPGSNDSYLRGQDRRGVRGKKRRSLSKYFIRTSYGTEPSYNYMTNDQNNVFAKTVAVNSSFTRDLYKRNIKSNKDQDESSDEDDDKRNVLIFPAIPVLQQTIGSPPLLACFD